MAKTHSHPICPTCESDLSEKKELAYFCSASCSPVNNDDVMNLYEEVSHLVRFLGALAQAAPLAVAQTEEGGKDAPEWVGNLSWLAEELTEEIERRLDLLREAGEIWEKRAEAVEVSKAK
jgi:hypothetical protein